MSKSNFLEFAFLALLFNGTAITDIAINDTSGPLTNLYVALHTADPGEAGFQDTSEATYTSYARVAVPRNSSGWTISGTVATNTAAVIFPEATGGNNTITYFSIGRLASGVGHIYYRGALLASLLVSSGIEPQFAANDIQIFED